MIQKAEKRGNRFRAFTQFAEFIKESVDDNYLLNNKAIQVVGITEEEKNTSERNLKNNIPYNFLYCKSTSYLVS